MEWSRIKTIILIILVITNLGLLSFLVQREAQTRAAQQEARQNAVEFLQKNHVSVDEETIPENMGLIPQTVERDQAGEEALASALLGTVQQAVRGGEAYRYYNENGYIQFHQDGTFEGDFVAGAFPAEEGSLSAFSQEILARLNFDGLEIRSSASTSGEVSTTSVTLLQTWNGVPIFNRSVTLNYQDGCLVSMTEGRRLTGEPQPDTSRTVISVPTALFRFYHGVSTLGDVCSRIDRIEEGYLSSMPAGTGPSTLTPVWYITTDTGVYLLDTVSGELSRADTEETGDEAEDSLSAVG